MWLWGGVNFNLLFGTIIWTPLDCHGGCTFSLIYIYYLQFFYLIKSLHSACLNMYLNQYHIFGRTYLFCVVHWPVFGSWPPQFSSSSSVCFVPLASIFVYGAGRLHPSVHFPPTCYLVFLLALFLQYFMPKSSLRCKSSILMNWPAHMSLFIQIYVEKDISLYMSCTSSWYLILHTPCEWVGLNIFWRIFHLKNQFCPWLV